MELMLKGDKYLQKQKCPKPLEAAQEKLNEDQDENIFFSFNFFSCLFIYSIKLLL